MNYKILEKAAATLADKLEGFNLTTSDNYDFDTDFTAT